MRRGGWPAPRGEPPPPEPVPRVVAGPRSVPGLGSGLATGLASDSGFGGAARILADALRPDGPLRGVEVLALRPDGSSLRDLRAVPVLPAFDAALLAFPRAALAEARREGRAGLMPVEDLAPGDEVLCAGGFRRLLWRAATALRAGEPLLRVLAGTAGLHRPEADLCLGPAARWGGRSALALADGEGVVALRARGAVPMLHLGFARPERVLVGGLSVAAFHPDEAEPPPEALRPHWAGLLPHLAA